MFSKSRCSLWIGIAGVLIAGCGPPPYHGPDLQDWLTADRPEPCQIRVDDEDDGVWDHQLYREVGNPDTEADGTATADVPHSLLIWCQRPDNDRARGPVCERPDSFRRIQAYQLDDSGRFAMVANLDRKRDGILVETDWTADGLPQRETAVDHDGKDGWVKDDTTLQWRDSRPYRASWDGTVYGHKRHAWDGDRYTGWTYYSNDITEYAGQGQILYDQSGRVVARFSTRRKNSRLTNTSVKLVRDAPLEAWLRALPLLTAPGAWQHDIRFADQLTANAPVWEPEINDAVSGWETPEYWEYRFMPEPDAPFRRIGDEDAPLRRAEWAHSRIWMSWDPAGDLVRERVKFITSGKLVEYNYVCEGPPRVSFDWSNGRDVRFLRRTLQKIGVETTSP